ncbi:SDR family oxidoreductase [Bacillus sp. es.036]|uniref:SDR family oxidoreductase n=1 Tax=Bacillus sp. es.036 TaxID=1761764 RepID=UPI000BFAAE54|nr:SDR family oxidoreductase [Bacillus sp. es.036]PFG12409.1 uncharacterized protein YbjT (DUF2867 family) [Bacillus sp. es.036]
MSILVTGFNGKVGLEVAKKLKEMNVAMKCAVRNVVKAASRFGDHYHFVELNFSDSNTFDLALEGVEQVFLIYPPGGDMKFEKFLQTAKEKSVQQIVYLSVKDVQYLPFIHHFKNEKMIKKLGIPYTFIRAGYFMQNLNDFLGDELRVRHRIFVPAGKGKTSFVDTRDLAEVASMVLTHPEDHQNKNYVITGDQALDFFDVAKRMTDVLQVEIHYTNPTVKEFKEFMLKKGVEKEFIDVVVGIHFPTKLGLAKGITNEYEKVTNKKPRRMEGYINDYKDNWV